MKEARIVIGVLLLCGAAGSVLSADDPTCLDCLTFQHRHVRPRAANERCASTSLKTLSSAQADFRANDRDEDGVNQFWRLDVAGLYAFAPAGGAPIKLVELSVAAADGRPSLDLSAFSSRSPKSGFWYRAIRHADEDPKKLNPQRFAYCAYPDTPEAGQWMFVVDENNTIYRTLAQGRRGVDVFPTDQELNTLWTKLD